jgi:murein DD-endopeptidase MepM/ murein hydrolase activator NlpD
LAVARARSVGPWAVAIAALGCSGASPTRESASLCRLYPPQATSPYVLPYLVGESYRVTQTVGHGGTQRFAVDFDMPIGAPFTAVREGVVVAVEESFYDGDRTPGHENFVAVAHADGTVARYLHLTREGALVEAGEAVEQGRILGQVGETGNATGPHLHVDVAACCCALPPELLALPCGETQPLTFRNAAPHPCGLEVGVAYVALPF